jgi:Gas vesicle synthesis protein GvpL/GvpF
MTRGRGSVGTGGGAVEAGRGSYGSIEARGRHGSLYVYALLERRLRSLRLSGRRIEFVSFGSIAAAVERRKAVPKISERSLREQHRIVTRLLELSPAMLPVRFGTLVDAGELGRIITLRRSALKTALRRVRGKAQMTIRVFGPAVGQAPNPAIAARSGTEYLQSRAGARPLTLPWMIAIRRAVQTVVSAERAEGGHGAVQGTLHHLVTIGRLEEYRSRVDRAVRRLEPRARLVVSGPFPPFAFAPDLWE